MMNQFKNATKQSFERLEQYVPIVERVHGANHPEFYDVRKLFDQINAKRKESAVETPDIDNELKQLREITDNYTIPGNVCESYEAVYNMLSEIDEAYRA